jgi:hypothetical protein
MGPSALPAVGQEGFKKTLQSRLGAYHPYSLLLLLLQRKQQPWSKPTDLIKPLVSAVPFLEAMIRDQNKLVLYRSAVEGYSTKADK